MKKFKLYIIICLLTLWGSLSFTTSSSNAKATIVHPTQNINDVLPTVANSNLIPPLKKKRLLSWLKAGNYKEMFTAEPAVHASTGPHGGNVRTFFNPILVEDLRAGRKTWRAGASMVKELYFSGQSQVIGFSVMVKLDDDSGPNAQNWLFYETFSGTNDNVFFGRSVPACYGCHSAGTDYLLSPFRP